MGTPTRYSLLTGTYAFRQKGTGIAPPNGPAIIKPGTETLPTILKRAGYATAVIGKWHLGLGDPAPNWTANSDQGRSTSVSIIASSCRQRTIVSHK